MDLKVSKFSVEWMPPAAEADEPDIKTVWPGSESIAKPEGEQRRLLDAVLPFEDVARAVNDTRFAQDQGYSARDMRLLRQAWALRPGLGVETGAAAKHEPRGPELP